MDTAQLKRIADAIEEILRLVKKDMEPRTKKENEDELGLPKSDEPTPIREDE
jgi:hypothetical protein